MIKNQYCVSTNLLQALEGTALFYPCSGEDLQTPIHVFAPYVTDFWFADIGYFREPESTDCADPVLRDDDYLFLKATVRRDLIGLDDWVNDGRYYGVPPCIHTEIYQHNRTGRAFRVHRHRRRAPTALRELPTDSLGVFFYRCDSSEGSTPEWYFRAAVAEHRPRERHIHEVLDRLVDGGLFVTDGSKCEVPNNPYRELLRVTGSHLSGPEAMRQAQPFTDDFGRVFKCVGHLGERYDRPTLVWQVWRHPKKTLKSIL